MLSFWEKDHWLSWDVLIIGAGIVGLSTAASILEKNPNKRVLILERGIFPSGASTKNAGFACFGSLTELVEDRKHMSDSEVVELVALRWEGLQRLCSRLGESSIGYESLGGYELISEQELPYLPFIEDINDLLSPIFDQQVFHAKDDLIKDFGFSEQHVKHLIFNPFEGQIHTGKMMMALMRYVQERGAVLLSGAEVKGIEEEPHHISLSVQIPHQDEVLSLTSDQLAVCTNAFSSQFFPDLDIQAGRGQVLISDPIPFLPFQGVFHYQQGYYYFRNVGKRLLLGGGRHLDFQGENTLDMQVTASIQEALEHLLKTVISPNIPITISDRWAGIMAFGPNKQPICRQTSERIYAGVRLGGMGIAIGSELGHRLAARMLPS